jgi:alkylated DNA repair dioxygenase AlkB
MSPAPHPAANEAIPQSASGAASHPAFQGTLFAAGDLAVGSFSARLRTWLDPACWVDHVPAWLSGADDLFAHLASSLRWHRGRRPMYGRMVDEPRLSASVPLSRNGRRLDDAVVDVRDALAEHYGRGFDSCWANFYRDGADSVAWHGDRVGRREVEPVVALVSLGGPRRFLLRPKQGGGSLLFELRSGDLLVMGGHCQTRFEHSVPKVARAQPRISVSFRHGGRGTPTWDQGRLRLPHET